MSIFQNSSSRQELLDKTLQSMTKKYKGSVVGYIDTHKTNVDTFSTGSLSLDYVCGGEKLGIPIGRSITIYGSSSSGKTTVALDIIRAVQEQGGTAAILDVESTITEDYVKMLGIDSSRLIHAYPETAEIALDMCYELAQSATVDVILVDSLDALVPKDTLEKDFDESAKMAARASLISRFFNKINPVLNRNNVTLISLAQTRANMDKSNPYSPDEKLAGAKAIRFYATLLLRVARKANVKRKDEIIGTDIRITVEKNKIAPPGRIADARIYFGQGVSREFDTVNLGERAGILKKKGAWYYYNGESIAQGKDALVELLRENKELQAEIDNLIRSELFNLNSTTEEQTE